jgi:hypothetical protein
VETFLGIFIGIIAGVLIGVGLTFYLWRIQHDIELKEKNDTAKQIRYNYLNDLIIECEQNLDILRNTGLDINNNPNQSQFSFDGNHIGNIERFEKAYPPLFLFNKENRTLFHKYMNKIKEYPLRMIMDMAYASGTKNYINPYSTFTRKEFSELLDTLRNFKVFLEKATNSDNNFLF